MKSLTGTVTLLLVAAAFLGVGWIGLTDPNQVLGPVGITLTNTAAFNEARAMYGGMHFAMGLLFLTGALAGPIRGAALMVALVFVTGLLVGRGVSVWLDGFPTDVMMWGIMVAEVLGVMLIVGALLKRRRLAKAAAMPVPPSDMDVETPAAPA